MEQSEKMELKSAVQHYKRLLQTEIFTATFSGLLHGQMLWYEKDVNMLMKAFYRRDYDVFGRNNGDRSRECPVADATVMLIENENVLAWLNYINCEGE